MKKESEEQTNYLEQLPRTARALGNSREGEIEILLGAAPEGEHHEDTTGKPLDLPTGIVFEDDYILVVRDAVRFPSGREGTYLRIFERPDLTGSSGSVCIPIRDGSIFLVKVYRHATRSWELEFPRGSRSTGEDPRVTAKREVEEEIGLKVIRATRLGEICANSGLLAGIADVFLVQLGPGAPVPDSEGNEAIREVVVMPVSELKRIIFHGGVRDGYTLAALMLADSGGHLNPP